MATQGDEFTKLASRHTFVYSVVVGAMAGIAAGLRAPLVGVGVGVAFAAVTYIMWRPGGFAHRITRDPGGAINTRQVALALVVFVITAAATALVVALAAS